MKLFLTLILLLPSILLQADNIGIFSIVTCPGEDSSTGMNISWAADSTMPQCIIQYSEAKGKKCPDQMIVDGTFCTTYDGISSKLPNGEVYVQEARFYKFGAALEGLKPDTEYRYIITSKDGSLASGEHFFKTSGAKRWKACVISDFHNYTPLPGRLVAATAMIGTIKDYGKGFDWILHLGDVCAWGASYSFWESLYEAEPFSQWMVAGVNGNHDNMSRVYELSNTYFRDANFNPRNGYEGEEGVCYWFMYGDALFIMLNNEDMRSDEGLAAAQKWVAQVLEQHPDARYKVVCEHYQWFFGESGKTSHYGRWSELFDKYGVDLALAGNNHIYIRTNAIYKGEESDGSIGTVYLQTPSSDNERGSDAPDPIEFNKDFIKYRWTEGGKTVGALLLDVTPKRMRLTLVDRNGVKLDEVEVKAKRR